MGVTLRPWPRPFYGPFISKFQSVCGGRAPCFANNRCEKWSLARQLIFFFHSPNPFDEMQQMQWRWWSDSFNTSRAFPTANFQRPLFSNSSLVFFLDGVPDRFGRGGDAETTENSRTWSHSKRRTPLSRGAAEGRLHAAAPSPAGNQPPELQEEPSRILKAAPTSSRRFVLNYLNVVLQLFWPEFLALELFDSADCAVDESVSVASSVLNSILGVQRLFICFRL